MTKHDLIAMIRAVLEEKMALPHLAHFNEDALLNEQLGLDSVLILQLLVHLELEYGLALPEEAVTQKQLGTVSSLADFLLQQTRVPSHAAATGSAG